MNNKPFLAALLVLCMGLAHAQAPAVTTPVPAPGEDFFKYVNGDWHRRHPIPGDKSSWGPTALVAASMRERLRGLIETAASAGNDPDARKIASFYASAMDEKGIERLGARPLGRELAAIAALRDKRDLAVYLARLGAIGASSPLDLSVQLDARDPSRYVPNLAQGELGMLDRSYYLQQNAVQLAARKEYLAFLTTGFTLLGEREAGARAADTVALETALAQAQWTAADSNDRLKTANLVQRAALATLAPGFDWQTYLAAAGVPAGQRDLVLGHPSYLGRFARLCAETPLATWKSYLVAQLLGSYAGTLSSPFAEAAYAFYGATLEGKTAPSPRWQKAVAWTESALGGPLGKLYVQRYFSGSERERARVMVDNIKEAFRASIDEITWMGPATRLEAQAKLATLSVKLGYPEAWRDYTGLDIRPDDLVGNLMRSRQFERAHAMHLLGRPVDRAAWTLLPQDMGANYHDELNAITVPAGRLQAPYFDAGADEAYNYGAIGSVIGHEISHAFDNNGAQFDSQGRLRDWWSASDRAAFKERTRRMVAQYARYSPLPEHHVDGELTLGENIADNLGLAIALRAYHRSLGGKPGPVLDGLTADQRFFIGYARSRSKVLREAAMLATLERDEHAPDEVRVNGAVRNQDAFHEAFGIAPGDPMYLAPADRIGIW